MLSGQTGVRATCAVLLSFIGISIHQMLAVSVLTAVYFFRPPLTVSESWSQALHQNDSGLKV